MYQKTIKLVLAEFWSIAIFIYPGNDLFAFNSQIKYKMTKYKTKTVYDPPLKILKPLYFMMNSDLNALRSGEVDDHL